jgi:hypothetical protein
MINIGIKEIKQAIIPSDIAICVSVSSASAKNENIIHKRYRDNANPRIQ